MGVCGVHPEIVWKTLTQKLLFRTQIQFATLKIYTRADGKAFLHLGYFFSPLLETDDRKGKLYFEEFTMYQPLCLYCRFFQQVYEVNVVFDIFRCTPLRVD